MRELRLVEVRMVAGDETPVVVLKEVNGPRSLAIWMSAAGAAGVVAALEPVDPDHPSPHDLIVDVVLTLGGRIAQATIVGHQEGVFYAELVIGDECVNARPSDAIAVALRAGCPIRCPEAVLAAVGVDLAVEQSEQPEDQVERFREFLDWVNPDDF